MDRGSMAEATVATTLDADLAARGTERVITSHLSLPGCCSPGTQCPGGTKTHTPSLSGHHLLETAIHVLYLGGRICRATRNSNTKWGKEGLYCEAAFNARR